MATRLHPSPTVHARRFDEDLILLDLGGGMYYSLDAVGSTIWEALAGGQTTDEAVAAVLAEYEVDEATARADAGRLIAELLAAGLLEQNAS
jgi:hypothetical protein